MKLAVTLLFCLSASAAAAQGLAPNTQYDPAIPTLKTVVGHAPGDEITTPEQIGKYLDALAKAAPDRTRLVEYAKSWEGRPLHYLLVGSPERIAKLDDIRRGMQALASGAGDADRLINDLPVVVWLIHGVHGNEITSSDAGLAEAYHLLAARGSADVDLTLKEALVIIDPMQNPDGRQRFVTQNLLGRSLEPDSNPQSAEHDEPWPGGRSNHYLFDMNRDYFALSQKETQGRARVMLEWFPQVVVDLHEMGGNSTYYFAPPAAPFNPLITDQQKKLLDLFGRANAGAFDQRGFPYFVRDTYDAFYPGYGDSWPGFHGAVAMTFEQASPRGLSFARDDGTTLTYKQGVTQHFTAAVTTALTAARNRERMLKEFLEYRRSAIALGQNGTREYLFAPAKDAARAHRLAQLLARQGVQVKQAEEPVQVGSQSLPKGTYIVPLAQPAGRLVRNLLDPDIKMDEPFLKEQDRRRKARLNDQIYDVTAWSLPLMFDVELVASDRGSSVRTRDVRADEEMPIQTVAVPGGAIGFIMPWSSGAAAMSVEALRQGIRIMTLDETFTHAGRKYPLGTAFIRFAGNAEGTSGAVQRLAQRHGAELVAVTESWTEEGTSLGSGRGGRLKSPRVLLAWDAPASSLSAGWARYVLEQRYGQRVSVVRGSTLQNFDMKDYDVLVLPSGSYSFSDDGLRRIKDWIRNGGTLITMAESSRWAARDRVGLLSTDTLWRDGSPVKDAAEREGSGSGGSGSGAGGSGGGAKPEKPDLTKPFDLDKAIQPEREGPENLAGAILRVILYPYHWLTAGLDGDIQTAVEGSRVFAPLKLDAGTNVGVYAPADRLVAAGLVWKEAQPLLAQRAYLMHEPMGRGHVIAFAEDPNYRAYAEATQLLFINAVLLGAGH
ncbi:MAG TPA: M14 metallopeptidase family protein [Vicinamibacterales bacterium]|nr:M14 metallopeptidase family protein [Vicinamibacterales bacterium]